MSLSSSRILVVGLGSIGSAVADMLARAGAGSSSGGKLILMDPDELDEKNCARHVLNRMWVGKPKVFGMAEHIFTVAPRCDTELHVKRFGEISFTKPDVIACCVDSLAYESLVNAYALAENVPAVYGGVHGDAHTAEIITVMEGYPCYDCWEREGELPTPGQEDYTNPDYDKTRTPSMPGLWGDVLMAASLQFQAVLGILGARKKFPPMILVSLRYPFRLESHEKKGGCAICSSDFSKLTI